MHTLEWFLERAREVHGDKYSYDSVVYAGIDTKVTIGCPVHGQFEQTPYRHLASHYGCYLCSLSLGRYTRFTFGTCAASATTPGTFYVLMLTHAAESFLKVGITINSIARRSKRWRRNHEVVPLITIEGPLQRLFLLEQDIIGQFSRYWYCPKSLTDGFAECFRMDGVLDICEYVDSFATGEYSLPQSPRFDNRRIDGSA